MVPAGPGHHAIIFCGFHFWADFFYGDQISWAEIIATYIGLPIFLLLWLGYKIIKKTKIVPLMECDFERKE